MVDVLLDQRVFSNTYILYSLSRQRITMEMKKHREDQFTKLAVFLKETKQPFINVQTDQITRAMELLKVLPAAQDAVLEYYGKFFDYAISTYLKQLKVQVLC